MKRELLEQLKWLDFRHQVLMELVELNSEFKSDYMRGFNEGLKQTVALYVPEIDKIRSLVEGYLIDDLHIEEDEKCSNIHL